MDILKTLGSLKSIEPDREYTLRSKAEILRTEPQALPWYRVAPTGFGRVFNSPAMVLAAMVVAVIGSVGLTEFFTTPTAVIGTLDTHALEAEAQAIDIQIQLADLQYEELAEAGAVASVPTGAKKPSSAVKPSSGTTSAPSFEGAIAPASSSTDVAIDNALAELAQ